MSRRLGVIMDPISAIKPNKDTTLALLLAAARHGFELHYMEMSDLSLRDGRACARTRPLSVHNALDHWYDFSAAQSEVATPLADLDVVLMRKDPQIGRAHV